MSKLLVDCFKITVTFGDVVASRYSLRINESGTRFMICSLEDVRVSCLQAKRITTRVFTKLESLVAIVLG